MNNCFSRSPLFQEPVPYLPTEPVYHQGQLGHSAPRRYYSHSSRFNYTQELSSFCPPFGCTAPRAISPYNSRSPRSQDPRLFQPASYQDSRYIQPSSFQDNSFLQRSVQDNLPEHTTDFVRKDSYWTSLPATSISDVRRKVARTFADIRADDKKAKRIAFRERLPFGMSSSTALLPKDRKKDDHPIFLRVCHSPWISIGQKALVGLRASSAAYLLASFGLIIHYELKFNNHGALTAFEFSNIVYFLQTIYACITFVWTFMHLYYPHHANQIPTTSTKFQKCFSPPRQSPTSKNRICFSIFYIAAVTYPHVVTFIHWAILVPEHESTIPIDHIFDQGWYTEFYVINKFVINSVIALIEVFIHSSIRRSTPIPAHLFGLLLISLMYVGWAFVGYIVCDKYGYFFFDHKRIGWACVGYAVGGFVSLAWIFFAFVYGLTGIREKLTRRGDERGSSGYARLPQ